VRYKADITAGGLKMRESRIVADLLLKRLDAAAWKSAIEGQNLLQAKSKATARRLLCLIKGRLMLMGPDHWLMVRDGPRELAVQAVFAAAVKQSSLLGDFLDLCLRQEYRIFTEALPNTIWPNFIEDCKSKDLDMPDWTPSTIQRLRSSVFQMLAETAYFNSSRAPRLQKVYLIPELRSYLENHEELYVLRCMTACL